MILRRKFSEILKRGTLQNPCQKIPVVQSAFNKITGMDSRPAFFSEKKIPPRMFSCGYIRIFNDPLVRSNVNSGFGKTAGVYPWVAF